MKTALAIGAAAAGTYLAIGVLHARKSAGRWNLDPLRVLAWPWASRVASGPIAPPWMQPRPAASGWYA